MHKNRKRFHRLSVKFIFGITGILLLILTATLFINSRVMERYYLHRQRENVRQAGETLKEALARGCTPEEAALELEERENVLVAFSRNTDNYDSLSSDLREKFRQKGLGFQKFWLWEEDYISAVQNGYRFRLYGQEKLNYGILVEYIPVGDQLYAIAAIVPDAADFIRLVNRFSIVLYAVSLAAAVGLISLFVKHITNPLRQMEHFSRQLSRQEYAVLDIRTGDELETVAESMNQMSRSLREYEKQLLNKNRQMKQLLDDVAHDIKTPVSLIGMYASGIKDGLDDGTFLDTIEEQNARISRLVERLLSLSRIESSEYPFSPIALDTILHKCMEDQRMALHARGLSFQEELACDVEIMGNSELVALLFSNLLSNAVKYASSGAVEVTLCRMGEWCRFRISNGFNNAALDPERIWDPFYVGEPSRSRALTGTGLGLAIVKRIAEQYGYSVRCEIGEGRILFEVLFPAALKNEN